MTHRLPELDVVVDAGRGEEGEGGVGLDAVHHMPVCLHQQHQPARGLPQSCHLFYKRMVMFTLCQPNKWPQSEPDRMNCSPHQAASLIIVLAFLWPLSVVSPAGRRKTNPSSPADSLQNIEMK